jgi:3-oxoacyl-[acyl-carrier-protein] synthase III
MSIHSKVVATGHFLPEIEIRNADLTQFPPASIALIEEKTGVRARRHAPRSRPGNASIAPVSTPRTWMF